MANFSVKKTESVFGQQAPTFELTSFLRLNLAQSLKKERYNDVATVVTIIKTTKTEQKQKEKPKFIAGCLPKALLYSH